MLTVRMPGLPNRTKLSLHLLIEQGRLPRTARSMPADGDPSLETSGLPEPRRPDPRSRDDRELPGRRGQHREPGLHRSPQSLRRTKETEPAEPVAARGFPGG